MDLLFKRYASPFLLLDNLILTNSSSSFIDDFCKFIGEDTNWEYFLHKVFDKSWKEFCDEIKIADNEKEVDLGATLIKSKSMLQNFTPESEV